MEKQLKAFLFYLRCSKLPGSNHLIEKKMQYSRRSFSLTFLSRHLLIGLGLMRHHEEGSISAFQNIWKRFEEAKQIAWKAHPA